MPTNRAQLYGSGLDYPLSIDPATGGYKVVEGVDSVRAALRRLLDTSPGDERFNPGFGCSLQSLVFETDTVVLRALCDTVIRAAVARWEPRIAEIVDLQITNDAAVPNTLNLRVFFRLIQSQTVENVVIPFATQG